ncbi:helix-turn-helix domain-containing protein [Shewanella japonica]|uniref:helix-turn-helix domain-containing protein n=1 Tax=Shewanella japonica TaxID=93973 RepID=UPI0013C4DC31|nr:helix-turn-helix domain-containing protein [Shewanella japonica]
MKILKGFKQGEEQVNFSVKEIRTKYGVTSNVAKETFDYLVKNDYAIRHKPKNIKGQKGSNACYKLTVDFFHALGSSDEHVQFQKCIDILLNPDPEVDGQRKHALNQSQRLLLSILLSRASKFAIVDNVSVGELAELMGVSHRRVKSLVSILKKKEYIHFYLPGKNNTKLFGRVKSHYHLNIGKLLTSKLILIPNKYTTPFDVCQYFMIANMKNNSMSLELLDMISLEPECGVSLVKEFKYLQKGGVFNGKFSVDLLYFWRLLINKQACQIVEERIRLEGLDFENIQNRISAEFSTYSGFPSSSKVQSALTLLTSWSALNLAKSVFRFFEDHPEELKPNLTYSIIGFTGTQVVDEIDIESFDEG